MALQNILIAHPTTIDQINALKVVLKALKVTFEIKEQPYNQYFVTKIEKSRQDYQQGKGEHITLEQLNKLWK